MLSEAGEIAMVDGAGSAVRYDACVEEHYHFRCERCGQLIDVSVPIDPDLDLRVQQATGLSVRCHVIEFRGLCDKCPQGAERKRAHLEADEMAVTGRSAT